MDGDRVGEVLQAVLAEIDELGVGVDERPRLARDENLAAVAGGRDPGAQVDVGSDIAAVGEGGCAGVDADPDVERTRGEAVGDGTRRCQRSIGRWEGDEEGIALRVDLDPTMGGAGRRISRRCSARASAYPSAPSSPNSRVEPSMSVKRKVTRPAGRSGRTPGVLRAKRTADMLIL
jgi:hypothetical protein